MTDILSKLTNSPEYNQISYLLRDVYSFTEQQLGEVLKYNMDSDVHVLYHAINDVNQQYNSIPLDIPINEYLYDVLMNITSVDEKKRNLTINNDICSLLDGDATRTISYRDFLPRNTFSDEDVPANMELYIQQHVKDFFIVHIDEDIQISSNNKSRLDSKMVQHYISWSRMMWINFYVFVEKNGTKKIAVGVQKWSTWNSNDAHFGELFKKYNAQKFNIPLSSFLLKK